MCVEFVGSLAVYLWVLQFSPIVNNQHFDWISTLFVWIVSSSLISQLCVTCVKTTILEIVALF